MPPSKLTALLIPLPLLGAWVAHLSPPGLNEKFAQRSTAARIRPVEPAAPALSPASSGFTDAQFAKHVEELKARLKKKLSASGSTRSRSALTRSRSGELSRRASGEGSRRLSRSATELLGSPEPWRDFSIVIQKPFVVIGDEPKELVQQHAENTVKWAVERLKKDFFANDPNDILDIWLFKDEASYEKYTKLLFGQSPTTPYGFYSPTHKALIMNIAIGGGTLVHELVHPFVEANFPACPPWLNEGLGSLYEQCGDKNGHIHGFVNWRLPGLQHAIDQRVVPSFKKLTEMDANAFYGDNTGLNYAQARYLCFYLQEKGLLRKFYQEFRAKQKEDAGGFKSLQKVLVEPDMDAFKIRWEKYVMGLRQGWEVSVP